MNILRRTLVAVALTVLVAVGFTSMASAAEVTYNPAVCTDGTVLQDGQCVEVLGVTQQQDPAVAVSSAGTLPYTGSDSTMPLAEIGVALLAAGGLMIVMVRRHRSGLES